MKTPALPEIGRIVEVVRGRDRGLYAVVVGHEPSRFVQIADGDKRKVDSPKKKNVLHIRTMPMVADEVAQIVAGGGRVTNANLRYAVRRFLAEHPQRMEAQEEEGVERGEG
ncbi:KOW domain-containing RNA-binding protein [Alicyclobacillus sp. ALC3]|uniref:KOW domain-containing RNA-binding protein n=1 Tax=Alicyclobacillus sp. ALC3 TaxID=2796143 RepID=UPI0023788162|nr:KOW domain-containing RNA-binding protein [Alicyclobacillus sp. ALC3]WDL98919.1 KOW domain-containing RNA-binding protein [Alicyclobacillus sp. ALC3]